MYSALDIAKYIIALQPDEDILPQEDWCGEHIAHLKLQKLLYYIQGYALALYDRPMFREAVLAWPHGPVVQVVYDAYKKFGYNPLPYPKGTISLKEEKDIQLIKEVYEEYSQFSAWKLRNMTHQESPWVTNWSQERWNRQEELVIDHSSLKKFFTPCIVDG